MPVTDIPFADWLPDAPDFKNPGCEVVDGVYPDALGFRPFPGIAGSGEEIPAPVRGANLFFNTNGAGIIVGGTDTSLFVRGGTTIVTDGYSSIGDGSAWEFARFNDFVVATAVNNVPQYLDDIDTDTTWEDLPGSPPRARHCARVADFLMLGDIDGARNRIQWSAFNNPTGDWTPSRLTQAGFADMPRQFGEVQRIVGGRYAMIFQARGISRLSYVGPPTVWNRTTISTDRGAIAPHSVVTAGYFTFFLAQDGFYVTNGSSIQPIGTQRINRWFFQNVNQQRLSEVQGAVDWQNECIVWSFHTAGSEERRGIMIYSWVLQRWSYVTLELDWIVDSTEDGVNLDQLDAIYGDLDSIPVSLDSSQFKGRSRVLGLFTTAFDRLVIDDETGAFVIDDETGLLVTEGRATEYGTFSGPSVPALIETGEFQPQPNRRVFVSEVTPVMEATNWDASFTLLMKDNQNAYSTSATAQTGWSGFAPVRGEGMKMALRFEKPEGGDWENVTGAQVQFKPAGRR